MPDEIRAAIDPIVYWTLATFIARAEAIEYDAKLAIAGLAQRKAALLATLSQQHGFDAAGTIRLDDDGCILTASAAPPKEQP